MLSWCCYGILNPNNMTITTKSNSVFLIILWLFGTPLCSYAQDNSINISIDPLPAQCIDDTDNCTATVNYGFQIDVDCPFGQLEVEVFLNIFNDGPLLPISNMLNGSYPDYSVSGSYPLGTHSFEVAVDDGCGNTQTAVLPFEVVDCDVLPPGCATGLLVEVLPVDNLGDGLIDGVQAYVTLDDLLAQPVDDCTPPVAYAIGFEGQGYTPGQDTLLLGCDHLGTLPLAVYAQDALGNTNSCLAFLEVQNNSGFPCPDMGVPGIAGMIMTEQGAGLAGVEVLLTGGTNESTISETDGTFLFSLLPSGLDYTLTPSLNEEPLNGVSTLDLVLISQHILGVAPLGSPYKRIAADANGSGQITTLDLIQLRRMILGIEDDFENVPSWRFVDASYVLPNLPNSMVGVFPESITLNDFLFFSNENNFIAIKIGDVNGDALTD